MWPASWNRRRVRSTTAWPRCRSEAVGSSPSFTRSRRPVAILAISSPGVITSTAPCVSEPRSGSPIPGHADRRLPRPPPSVAGERQWCRCDSCDRAVRRLRRTRPRRSPSRRGRSGRLVALVAVLALGATACSYTADLTQLTSAVPRPVVGRARRRRQRARPARRRHPPHRRAAEQDVEDAAERGRSRSRTIASTTTPASTSAPWSARCTTDLDKGEIARGRVDDHAAVRAQRDAQRRQDRAPQAARDRARRAARAPLHEGADPRALPQPRVLRKRLVRRPERGAALLRHAREHAHARADRAARRADPGARGLQPVRRAAARAEPAQRGARQDGRVRIRDEGRRSRRRSAQPLGLHPRADDNHIRAPYFVAAGRAVRPLAQAVRRDDRRSPPPPVHRRARDPHDARSGPPAAGAESALDHVLVDPAHDPSGALVSIEPTTGHVVAYVGGRDFYGSEPYAQFDLASQGRRQAGSTFKPFVLAAALEEHIPLVAHVLRARRR